MCLVVVHMYVCVCVRLCVHTHVTTYVGEGTPHTAVLTGKINYIHIQPPPWYNQCTSDGKDDV